MGDIIFQPRNRNVAPDTLAFSVTVAGFVADWFVNDQDSKGNATEWGCPNTDLTVCTYHRGRFVLCDKRGSFTKNPCRGHESKPRVKTFGSYAAAGRHAITLGVRHG